jgi:hypothetical protein
MAVDLSATPAGWVPVAYGDAQISVPSSFSVFYPGWDQCGASGYLGALFLGQPTPSAEGCGGAAPPTRQFTTIAIRQATPASVSAGLLPNRTVVINGLRLSDLINHTSGNLLGYYAPALGVEILDSGPLSGRILHTLTQSPRTVVLASGPGPAVPSGWHVVTFGGLTFESPPSWTVSRTAVTGGNIGWGCGRFGATFPRTKVVLSTDKRSYPVVSCPPELRPNPLPPENGVEVDAGRTTRFPVPLAFSKRCLDIHGLTACPATSLTYSILFLKVTVPGRTTPVVVSIGLVGNGMVARTILYSLRAA